MILKPIGYPETDPFSIHLDGTSTTTAPIPHILGLNANSDGSDYNNYFGSLSAVAPTFLYDTGDSAVRLTATKLNTQSTNHSTAGQFLHEWEGASDSSRRQTALFAMSSFSSTATGNLTSNPLTAGRFQTYKDGTANATTIYGLEVSHTTNSGAASDTTTYAGLRINAPSMTGSSGTISSGYGIDIASLGGNTLIDNKYGIRIGANSGGSQSAGILLSGENSIYFSTANTGLSTYRRIRNDDTTYTLYFEGGSQTEFSFSRPVYLQSTLDVTGTTTLATSLTGILKGTSGLVSVASGADLAAAISVTSPITNSGSTIGFDQTVSFSWSGTHLFNADLTLADSSTGAGPYINIGDNSMAAGWVSIQNDQIGTGNIYIEPQGGFSGQIYAKELGATFEGSFYFGILNHSTFAEFGSALTSPVVAPGASSDGLSVKKQSTSAAIRGMLVQTEWNGASTSANAIQGQNIFVTTATGATGSLTGTNALRANRAVVRHRATNAAATVANAIAMSTQIITDTSAAAMTNAYSYKVESPSIGLGSTLTNYYGIYFDPVTISGTLTNYTGLFIPAVTSATNNYEVWLDGDASIFFRSSDQYIYSSAASTLDLNATTTFQERIGGSVINTLTSSNFTTAANFTVSKATPAIFLTDSGGDDYTIDVGSTAGLLRIRNTTDSSNGLQIDGSGNVAVSTSYAPQTAAKFYVQDRTTNPASSARAAFSATMEMIVTSANWSGGNMRGFLGGTYWDGSTRDFNNGSVQVGLEGGAQLANMAAARIVGSTVGLFGTNSISGTGGTVTSAANISGYGTVSGGVVVTNFYGFDTGSISASGGSTITTLTGYRVRKQTGGTTNYDMLFDTDAKANFRDGNQYIQSSAASTLDLSANTTMNFRAAGAIEMTMAANSLTFNNGATDCFIDWTSSGVLKFYSGANNFFEFGSEAVINQDGGKLVFRVEGDTDQNLICTDPTNNRVGIKVNAPGSALDVAGSFQCDSITNDTGLAAGTYTPTLANVADITSSTAYQAQYLRVGNTVNVSGKVLIDVSTGGGTTCQLGISLPIASNFGADEDCAGTANNYTDENIYDGIIVADTTSDRAELRAGPRNAGNQYFFFTFTYQVI